MQFVTPQPFQEAIDKLGSRTVAAAGLDSAQWGRVPVALRERAFFSSRVESVRFLQRARGGIGDFLTGSRETITRPDGSQVQALATGSRAQFVRDMQTFLKSEGVTRDTGGLTDITSEKRLGLIFDVQTRQAQDYGNWQQGQDPDVLDAFPAQRFIRVIDVKEPRDSHTPHEGTVMLKSDVGFWSALNEDFGVPWGPWGWGCGHDVEDVDREEAEQLGLIQPGERPAPGEEDFNDRLESGTARIDSDLVDELKRAFSGQNDVEFSDKSVRWKPRAVAPPAPKPTPAPSPIPAPQPAPAPKPLPKPDAQGFVTIQEAVVNPGEAIPAKPLQNPVSQAAVVQMTGKQVRQATEHALRMIDKVHDDGQLTPVPFNHKVSGRAQGTYYHGASIGVRKTGATNPELTTAHEVGHWLDHKALPGAGYSSETHPLLAEWRTTVEATDAHKALRESAGYKQNPKYRRYQLEWREVWARSYAQYIATRAGDARMLGQIESVRAGKTGHWIDSQWSATEFQPVAAAIDNLFKTLGWL